jgi:hypothetical protein
LEDPTKGPSDDTVAVVVVVCVDVIAGIAGAVLLQLDRLVITVISSPSVVTTMFPSISVL